MKKIIAVLLIVLQLGVLSGCGQEQEAPKEEIITIVVPRELSEEKTDEEIVNDGMAQGLDVQVDKKRDTVIYRMTREQNNAVLFGLKGQMDEIINGYEHAEDPASSFIKKITYNERMTTFDIVVDRQGYANRSTDKTFMNIFSAGATYQLFSSRKPENIDVKMRIFEENKKKPFEVRTMMENSANAVEADDTHGANAAD